MIEQEWPEVRVVMLTSSVRSRTEGELSALALKRSWKRRAFSKRSFVPMADAPRLHAATGLLRRRRGSL
jgi:hypothetical protein